MNHRNTYTIRLHRTVLNWIQYLPLISMARSIMVSKNQKAFFSPFFAQLCYAFSLLNKIYVHVWISNTLGNASDSVCFITTNVRHKAGAGYHRIWSWSICFWADDAAVPMYMWRSLYSFKTWLACSTKSNPCKVTTGQSIYSYTKLLPKYSGLSTQEQGYSNQ